MSREPSSHNSAEAEAACFLKEETAFRLGSLLTESAHPKTLKLGETASVDTAEAIRLLQSVDEDIPPAARRMFESPEFTGLTDAFLTAMRNRKKLFFTGCGSTGRLSILLETAWRSFWRKLKQLHPALTDTPLDLENHAFSVMAGGDFALIKAVEGFEDYPAFGRFQLKELGIEKDDVVVAITEGGETPFVIGTAWEGVAAGAHVFFVFNNPASLLKEHVVRSDEVLEDPRITSIDLSTGPMAVTGSTRMQATTIELLFAGAALESALTSFLKPHLPADLLSECGCIQRNAVDYPPLFEQLLHELETGPAVDNLAAFTDFETELYRKKGLVTYAVDSLLLDVLTDTTERSPTFMLPPFRAKDDTTNAPPSWAFVKNPFRSSTEAWNHMLQRDPRGLAWGKEVYSQLNAPCALQEQPPRLGKDSILQFRIGNENDPSRTSAVASAIICIARDAEELKRLQGNLNREGFTKQAAVCINRDAFESPSETGAPRFLFPCSLIASPLRLWHHLAVKLILNTVSTASMAAIGRVRGNAMIWLSPSNKKLIDRGSRLIAQLAGCSYETACVALHKAMQEVEARTKAGTGEQVPSPVALAIDQLEEPGNPPAQSM